MRLYKDGINRITDNPNIIADLKKAGYVEVKEGVGDTAPKETEEIPKEPEKEKEGKK